MKIRTIFALCLATATLALTSCNSSQKDENVTTPIENIMTRTSIRAFTPEKLTDAEIETLLRAGMAAPTAVNKQPWDFVVVDDPALLDSLQAALSKAPITRANCQQVIVVCGNMQKALEGDAQAYWIQDCSAATQNILLAAHAMGLGAVWCGVLPIKERIEVVSAVLKLPSFVRPLCVIPVGHPAEAPQPKDKWKPENVHRNAAW